jgi:hypothetical protein
MGDAPASFVLALRQSSAEPWTSWASDRPKGYLSTTQIAATPSPLRHYRQFVVCRFSGDRSEPRHDYHDAGRLAGCE